MDSNIENFEKSPQIRNFLHIFRFFALLAGLILTWDPNTPRAANWSCSGMPQIVIAVILVGYHCLAALWMHRFSSNKLNMKLLVVADLAVGLASLVFLGTPFVFAALVLPALVSLCFLGRMMFLSVICIMGIIFLVSLIGEYPNIMNALQEENPKPYELKDITLRVWQQNIGFFLCMIPSIIAAFSASIAVDTDKFKSMLKVQDEFSVISSKSNEDKSTIQGLSNALMNKEQELKDAQVLASRLQEEADQNIRKYHEQREQAAAATEKFRNKENEITSTFDSKLKKIQIDNADLASQLKRSESMVRIAVDLNKSLNLNEAYVSVVEHLIKLVPVQTCILFMLDTVDKRTEIFAEMVYSPYSEFFRNFSVKMGAGIVGMAAELQQTLQSDFGSVTVDGREVQGLLSYEKSALAVPILYEEEILGVFYLGKKEESAFSAEDAAIVTTYASLAAVPLQNAQLFQKTVSGGMFDDITGFYNAIYFNERFGEEVARSRAYKRNLSIALFDIDNFAALSDEFGASWSEDVLREVSEVIREQVREGDVVARIQAGQFAVILPELDKRNAYMVAEKVRTSFEQRNMSRMRRSRASATLSAGVASFPYDAQTKENLISAVEAALGNAKNSGGNRTMALQQRG